MTISFTIDSNLPLPLGTQLRGLIEYGIACGELEAGSRLPSVRALAEEAGIAPMTVSQVYKELQDAKLIEGRPGQGTFVSRDARPTMSHRDDPDGLQAKVDELISTALGMGYDRADLARLFSARLNRVTHDRRDLHLAMVGVFDEVTKHYAAELRDRLRPLDKVTGTTVERLQKDPKTRAKVAEADLVLVFANRRTEVAALLRAEQPIITISYIPSTETRLALAALNPLRTVGLVASFADFLPTMKAGVRRYAPQAGQILATALGQTNLPEVLRQADVVVYASGAEEVTARLPARTEAFEYRHMLHPRELRENVLPFVARLRAAGDSKGKESREAR
ncbi:MAG TPA: GntR family transcriptional regulator [Kiloniellaceae bacterium]|nr:GntR family transcriptional regulator [Kiloniellaceae bacterium]